VRRRRVGSLAPRRLPQHNILRFASNCKQEEQLFMKAAGECRGSGARGMLPLPLRCAHGVSRLRIAGAACGNCAMHLLARALCRYRHSFVLLAPCLRPL